MRALNRRERILAWSVGSGLLLLVGHAIIKKIILDPAAGLRAETHGLELEWNEFQEREIQARSAQVELDDVARRTFGEDPDQVAARAGEYLGKLILHAGLNDGEFTLLPLASTRLRGRRSGVSQVGWSVQGKGTLAAVVDLLHLLELDERVHKVENLNVTGANQPGRVGLSFRYVTLVLDGNPAVNREEVRAPDIDVEGRKIYEGIVRRDLLRPYIPKPPEAPAPPLPARADAPPAAPLPPGPETYKVVSLSRWKGESEILILDLNQNRTVRYRPGDELAGGTIRGVDYRTLPSRRNPSLNTSSRVIISVGLETWAIDRGDTLADSYKLAGKLLPPKLRDDARNSLLKD